MPRVPARRPRASVAGDPRPFAGVPIAVKDNRSVMGMPMTMGSELFGDFTPRRDAFLVRRLRQAGFVIVGKTALPEMGILPTTEPRRGGPARNPWDLARTPGGSSGGSAAAVAAGMVPIAHGNDGGGSTRIPAACCGLVGLKPVRGRVSPGPEAGDSLLTVDGVLTRTVAETAALLDVLAGPEPGDATWAPPPAEPFAATAAREPGRLRIAMTLVAPLMSATLDPECERAVREAAALLESLGHDVVEIDSPWPAQELLADFTRVFGPMVATGVAAGGRIAGREPGPEDVEPLTWALYEHARETSTLDHLIALDRLKAVGRQVVRTLDPMGRSADARARRAAAGRSGRCTGAGRTRWGISGAAGCSPPTRRSSTSVACRRSRCRCTTAATGCRQRSNSSGASSARDRCSHWPLRSRRHCHGPDVGRRSPLRPPCPDRIPVGCTGRQAEAWDVDSSATADASMYRDTPCPRRSAGSAAAQDEHRPGAREAPL